MRTHSISPPDSLKDLYVLSDRIKAVRSRIVNDIFASRSPGGEDVDFLRKALSATETTEQENGKFLLRVNGKKAALNLDYEIAELQKDLVYLESGEDELLSFLADRSRNFHEQVEEGISFLSNLFFQCFVTDRDGTTNNYCDRYRSSIQSVWNGVFLSRFAQKKASFPVILTSGPLKNPGILDVSVNPEGSFIYAASKGREFLDLHGTIHTYPIERQKQRMLDVLNARMAELIEKPEFQKFGLIGSGLQFKFGQTTVARQDISGSVPQEESLQFLHVLTEIVAEIDPDKTSFRIEDTGMDVEIILTIETETGNLKDFDKGDAVRYLDSQLSMGLSSGPNLVCGDTNSDVPMLEAAVEQGGKTFGVFVTKKMDLSEKARRVCPETLIVSDPDVLVTILGRLADQGHAKAI
ncbi:MAG: trehalose 6-phosphate synthase [Desulfovibrionales bacterium]